MNIDAKFLKMKQSKMMSNMYPQTAKRVQHLRIHQLTDYINRLKEKNNDLSKNAQKALDRTHN